MKGNTSYVRCIREIGYKRLKVPKGMTTIKSQDERKYTVDLLQTETPASHEKRSR